MYHSPKLVELLESRVMLSADLAGAFTGKVPGAISLKSPTKLSVKLTNSGAVTISGAARLALFASADSVLDSLDAPILSQSIKLSIKPGKSQTVNLTFGPLQGINTGSYLLGGEVIRTGQTPSVFFSASHVSITAGTVDLTGTVSVSPKTKSFTVGGKGQKPLALTVVVANHGTLVAKGPMAISIFGSTNSTLDAIDPLLATVKPTTVSLNPNKSKKFTINIKPTASTPSGTFYAIAVANSGTTIKTAIVENNISNDSAVSSSTFVITNPSKPLKAAFAGGLSSDVSSVLVGDPDLVTFQATVTGGTPTTAVELDEVDASGNSLGKIGDLFDNGSAANSDATAGDGIFSGQMPIGLAAAGTRYFVAKVSDSANGSSGQTTAITITGVNAPTQQQLDLDQSTTDTATQGAYAIAAAHGTAAQIIASVAAGLASDSDVMPGSISKTGDSIIWKTTDGIGYCIPTDQLLGNRGASEPTQTISASAAHAESQLAASVVHPADAAPTNGQTALVLDPYQSDFGSTAPGDEAASLAQMLTDAGYDTTYVSNFQVASLSLFQNIGSNATVAIISHGIVDPTYGSFISTGVLNSQDPKENHTADLESGRLLLIPNGNNPLYLAKSSFFSRYAGSMDGTIVYLGMCHVGENNDIPGAFLDLGAGAVIAYTGIVYSDFAVPHALAAYKTLLGDTANTVGDIPGINVDTVTGPASEADSVRPLNRFANGPVIRPQGLVIGGPGSKEPATVVLNRFLSFGDNTATLPTGPKLSDVNLVITYSWPNNEKDLDSLTTFAGEDAGFTHDNPTYMEWSGDEQGAGQQETTIVDLYDAWKAGVFTTTINVGAGADWYTPDDGAGPAKVSIALEDIHTEKQYEIQSLVINPLEETDGASSQQATIKILLNLVQQDATVKATIVKNLGV